MTRAPTVYVVDDDASTRELLSWLMKREGLEVQTFAEARAFLESYSPDAPGCLILDLNMPGMSGLDLQQNLNAAGVSIPVVFLSGRADVPNAVRAVKEGAIDFIEKPFDYKQVASLVRECIARDARGREERQARRASVQRFAQLTQREREVLDLVVAGKTNRDIADALDISVKTVEAHRSSLMEKVDAQSVAELVQAALAARG
jgi:FixJ family two-component response regulator